MTNRKEYMRQYYLDNKPTPEMQALLCEARREKRKIYNVKARAKLAQQQLDRIAARKEARASDKRNATTYNPEGRRHAK